MIIKLHNTPQFYIQYIKNWLAKEEKDNAPEVQRAIIEDILTLVTVAAEHLTPEGNPETLN